MKNDSTLILATAILLIQTLVLPYPVAAQTILVPQIPQQTITSPTLQPATIAGTQVGNAVISVLDFYGSPISDAAISTVVKSQPLSVKTNYRGEVHLNSIPVGQYSYTVSKPGYFPQILTVSFTISANIATASRYVLIKYGSAKVAVADSGVAVPGATVSTTVNGKAQSLTTDAGGAVTFDNLPPGNYVFSASKIGYAGKTAMLSVKSGQPAALNIAVSQYGSAVVTVYQNYSTSVVSGATVNTTVNGKVQSISTDYNGKATFLNLPPGGYLFSGAKSNYLGGQVNATVEKGKLTKTSLDVETPNIVKAKVLYSGTAVSGATVIAISYPQGTKVQSATTDAGGLATLTLRRGSYQFYAEKAGFYSRTIDDRRWSFTSPVTENVDIYVTDLANLEVRTQDFGGSGIAGAVVNISLNGLPVQSATTDLQGKAVFKLFANVANYQVSASKPGYLATEQSCGIVSLNPGETRQSSYTMAMPVGSETSITTDLQAKALAVKPAGLAAGQTVTADVTVKNVSAVTSRLSHVYLYIDNSFSAAGKAEAGYLSPNQEITVPVNFYKPWVAVSGTHVFRMSVSSYPAPDSNKSNDELSITVIVP